MAREGRRVWDLSLTLCVGVSGCRGRRYILALFGMISLRVVCLVFSHCGRVYTIELLALVWVSASSVVERVHNQMQSSLGISQLGIGEDQLRRGLADTELKVRRLLYGNSKNSSLAGTKVKFMYPHVRMSTWKQEAVSRPTSRPAMVGL